MLTKKAYYAFQALTHLVEKYNEGPVLISEISEARQIPLKFLENILLELKNAGILDSKKGKGGGYFLKAHPAQTRLATVFRIIEGPISMLPCVSMYFYRKCDNCNEKFCGLHNTMEKVRDATLNILENSTLEDLVINRDSPILQ
ncbi:Rrf2 family transcriptional regulator [Paraflavisolibacter sp. H34]|uniref:RrF2 family transcriptional regulator n=1 Tax=Huijunlia imazamoxiresistens TaxID=3127457 RepID=UPI003019E037